MNFRKSLFLNSVMSISLRILMSSISKMPDKKFVKFLKPDKKRVFIFTLLLLGFLYIMYLQFMHNYRPSSPYEPGSIVALTLSLALLIIVLISMGPIILIGFGLHIIFGEMIDSIALMAYLPALIIYWWILSCAVVETYNKIRRDKKCNLSRTQYLYD